MILKKIVGITVVSTVLLFSSTCVSADSTSVDKENIIASGSSEKKELPKIKILATGGTIAGSSDSETDTTGYKPGSLGVEELIESVPQIKKIADVSGEQISNIGSENMDNATVLKLAKRINKLLTSKDVDGIVVTHGTDTMEETAYFLNLVVKSKKPVVMVGAMRPATAISADGPLNLYNAVKIASSKRAQNKGILVALNDQISAARYVTKTNTTATDTFKSAEQGYLGTVAGGNVIFYNNPTRKHTTQSVFDVSKLDKLPQVDVIYTYQNDNRYLYDAAVKQGAKGIIVAGYGNGTMSDAALSGAKAAVKKGSLVVRSSHAGSGTVTYEASDDKNKFITSDSLNPQKARILLMLALTKTKDRKQIQEYFNEY